VNDTTWLKGKHTIKFGANLRFTRVPTYTTRTPIVSLGEPSWVNAVGRSYTPAAVAAPCQPVHNSLPCERMELGRRVDHDAGILSESSGNYNYDRDGNPLASGEPAVRRWGMDEYEFYVQDSWQVFENLTVTGGLRYSLASPPWEVNGLQVAPTQSLGERFLLRQEMMAKGIPDNTLPLVQFELAGPENGKTGFYEWDTNNLARGSPRPDSDR